MKDISKTLRKLEYGVYIISVGKGNEGNAFTGSWLTQVSSQPPMVALAVHNKHQSSRLISEHKSFVVNLIGEGQEGVARTYFGPAESGYEKLQSAHISNSPATGSPLLEGAIGFLDCKLVETVAVGNHTLFVAEVLAAALNQDSPIMTTGNSKMHYAG